jgi:hypothetical protein
MSDAPWKASDIPDIEILSLIEAHMLDHRQPFAYQVLAARGVPGKVVAAKYEKLDRRGFLEVGTSVRTGWLSDKGEAHLASLRTRQP